MSTRIVRRLFAVSIVAAVVMAACSSDDDATPASEPSTVTVPDTAPTDTAPTDTAPTSAAPTSVTPSTVAPATTAAPVTTDAAPAAIVPDQWTSVDPGPECMCMDGSPFELWDRPGDPTKVVLYFEGGGACFSAETCNFDNATATVNLALGTPTVGDRWPVRPDESAESDRRLLDGLRAVLLGRRAHRQQDHRVLT